MNMGTGIRDEEKQSFCAGASRQPVGNTLLSCGSHLETSSLDKVFQEVVVHRLN